MRLFRKHSPATTRPFPSYAYTAEELMEQLGPLGRRALETKLRVDAKMEKYR